MKTKNKYILLSILVVGLITIDKITKFLCEGIDISVIPNFFSLVSVHNYGAGLGILSGKTTLLIILTTIFLLLFCLYDVVCKKNSKIYVVAISFIFAGAVGNLIDRIFLGYVRDFLYFNIKLMPYYFNVADVLLTVGIILFFIDILFFGDKKNKKIDQNKNENNKNRSEDNTKKSEL